jgi:hypothetical protein
MAGEMDADSNRKHVIKEYEKIEACLKRIAKLGNRTGYLTDYIILSTSQDIDDGGDLVTNTGWYTNPKNGMPYHRMIGLIEYCRHLMLKEALLESED